MRINVKENSLPSPRLRVLIYRLRKAVGGKVVQHVFATLGMSCRTTFIASVKTASNSVGLAFKCRGVPSNVVGNGNLRRHLRVFFFLVLHGISSWECRVARHFQAASPLSARFFISSLLWPLNFVFLSIKSHFLAIEST